MAANDPIESPHRSYLGDADVTDLVADWLPFVKRLARQAFAVAPSGELLDDIEGDAFEALLRALGSFDPKIGVPPASWIALKVRGAMIDGMRRRQPGPHRRQARLERLGSVEFVSLDAPVGGTDADRRLTLQETLADATAVSVEEQVEEHEQLNVARNRLRAALAKLSTRERRILVLRHVKEMSIAEVAVHEGVTARRIEAIERTARIRASEDDAAAVSSSAPHTLSEIELKVLESSAAGETANDTAKRLRKSTETVKSHRKAAIAKLKARNMCHAISRAHRLGILH